MLAQLLVTTALAAASVLAADSVAVNGRVVDAVANTGVAGATVEVMNGRGDGASQKLRTAADGSFQLSLPPAARFLVQVSVAGYAPVNPITSFSTRPEPGEQSLSLMVIRRAALRGTVIDEDTGKPIPNVRVWPKRVEYVRGSRELLLPEGAVTAGADGAFSVDDLPPGDYIVELNAPTAAQDSAALVREAYPRTFWPGAGDLAGAVPFTLTPGGVIDAGALRLRKRELIALTVKILGETCQTGQFYDVELEEKYARSRFSAARVRVPCDGSGTIPNADPGEYWLRASASWGPEETRATGILSVAVSTRALEIAVPVSPPVRIRGAVVASGQITPEGRVSQLPRGLSISLPPPLPGSGGFISPVRVFSGKVSPDGRFEFSAYIPPGERVQVFVGGLPRNYYVKQVRYNGVSSAGPLFTYDRYAPQQELEITVSDGAASLSGVVQAEDGSPAANAKVRLAPWPPNVISEYPWDSLEQDTDSSGRFAFVGLRPGKYRVISVPPDASAKLEKPGVLLTLFASAETTDITESSSKYVAIRPVRVP